MSCAFAASCSQRSWYADASDGRRGLAEVRDRGDQGDQLVLPSRSGTSYSTTRTWRARAGSRASPLRAASVSRFRAAPLTFGVHQDGPVGAVREEFQHGQAQVRLSPATAARPRCPRRCTSPASYRSSGRRSAASPPPAAGKGPGPGTARRCPSRRPGRSRPAPPRATRTRSPSPPWPWETPPAPRPSRSRGTRRTPRSPACPARPIPCRRCSSAASARGTPPR